MRCLRQLNLGSSSSLKSTVFELSSGIVLSEACLNKRDRKIIKPKKGKMNLQSSFSHN
jgi:hypothetical protein